MGYCLACGRNRTDIINGFCRQCRADEGRKNPVSAQRAERVNRCIWKWHRKPGHNGWAEPYEGREQ